MSLIFSYRSASDFNAYHCGANKLGATTGVTANAATIVADATAIGGNALSLDKGSIVASMLAFSARRNLPASGRAFSCLLRFKVATATGAQGLWGFQCCGGLNNSNFGVDYYGGGIRLAMYLKDGTVQGNDATYPWTPTPGQWYDLLITQKGDGSANSTKIWLDGVNVISKQYSSWTTNNEWRFIQGIVIGQNASSVLTTRITANEFVLWDTELSSGEISALGLGTARASFITATAFEGDLSVDPGITNVKNTTGYTINGVSLVGTEVNTDPGQAFVKSGTTYTIESVAKTGTMLTTDPGQANVKINTGYTIESVAKTGTYDGSDRYTDPGIANVLAGTGYTFNASARTGTLVLVSNVATTLGLSAVSPLGSSGQLTITQGDTILLSTVITKDGSSGYYIPAGATFETTIRGVNGTFVVLPDTAHTRNADQVAHAGGVTILLDNADTSLMQMAKNMNIVTKVTVAGEPLYFHGDKVLTVVSPTP